MKRAALVALLVVALPAAAFVPKDKAQHFSAGLGIGALTFTVFPMFLPNEQPWAPWAAAIAGAALSGIAKEVADGLGMGTPDLLDAVWTTAGGLFGALFADFLVNRLPPLSKGEWKKAFGLAFRGAF